MNNATTKNNYFKLRIPFNNEIDTRRPPQELLDLLGLELFPGYDSETEATNSYCLSLCYLLYEENPSIYFNHLKYHVETKIKDGKNGVDLCAEVCCMFHVRLCVIVWGVEGQTFEFNSSFNDKTKYSPKWVAELFEFNDLFTDKPKFSPKWLLISPDWKTFYPLRKKMFSPTVFPLKSKMLDLMKATEDLFVYLQGNLSETSKFTLMSEETTKIYLQKLKKLKRETDKSLFQICYDGRGETIDCLSSLKEYLMEFEVTEESYEKMWMEDRYKPFQQEEIQEREIVSKKNFLNQNLFSNETQNGTVNEKTPFQWYTQFNTL